MAGCGNTYRPVVSAINPVGPSAQPQKFAVAISSPSPSSPGLVTIVDFSGDTILNTTNIGVAPKYLILGGGTTGYTINGDGTLNSFGISTSLIASQVQETTLLGGANPVSIFPQGTNTYVTEPGRSSVAQFTGATPLVLQQELAVVNPIYVVGIANAPRVYALSQGSGGANGRAIAIDTSSNTPTAALAVGKTPVYGVMTADGKRAFVLNQGDGTVTVINAQTNQLDTLPASGGSGTTSTISVGAAPIWADFAPPLSEMVVANAGNGTNNGSLSIVSIPLCNAAALVTNPNCDATNPVDAAGFGTVLANVPVGINPVMVAALQDGTRAYVANSGNPNLPCVTVTTSSGGVSTSTPTGNCTVSVVNLTTETVTATIPIAGRPLYIAATTGTPTGKVYVVCSDSNVMTVIRTDLDIVTTTIPLQGTGVAVRVTAP